MIKNIKPASIVLGLTLSLTMSNNIYAQPEDESRFVSVSFKEQLTEKGYQYELTYTGEVFFNLVGGNGKHTVYLDNFDIVFNFDLQKILGLEGATSHFYGLGNNGGVPGDYAGALQGISNIAAYNTWKIYELWYEQNLFDEKLSLLFGLWDLNSEFDSRESSSLFINPSHGIGPDFSMTGKNGPSIFPTTSLSMRINYTVTPSLKLKFAMLDGVPGDPDKPVGTHIVFGKDDGLLLTTELNYGNIDNEYGKGYNKFALGAWYYTSDFEKVVQSNNDLTSTKRGNWGVYAFAEGFVFNEHNFPEQGLALFLRGGIADPDVNTINSYLGAGAHYVGLIPGRDTDEVGLAIAVANYKYEGADTEIFTPSYDNKFECILELTYKVNINDWIMLQPDIQYVINPGASEINNYSFVAGTRLQITF
jgi:porin